MKVALAIIAALFVLSGACAIAGVFLLAGLAWALIATSAALCGAAVYLRARLPAHG